MTEAESLLEIANAIKALAAAVGALAPPLWLMLIFKDMGGGNKSALKEIAEAIQSNAGRNAG